MNARTIYQTPEEIEDFKRLYPNVNLPEAAAAIQVTIIEGVPHIEAILPPPSTPGDSSPHGPNPTS